ncbi:hypothetical protein RMATCC62417_01357 [Rhizopus microsporus]|nr:hypothetical protein RMATCC62417_01357 [Rhizopus microsporus]
MDKSESKRNKHDAYWHQLNHWADSLFGHSSQSILPTNQQQQQEKRKRWVRLLVLFYIIFSILLTSAHFTRWFFQLFSQHTTRDSFHIDRTYDADLSYSAITTMPHGLKLSKMFPKSEYGALKGVTPFWQTASQPSDESDVSLLTNVSPESWKELVALAENYNGPISATLHVSKQAHRDILNAIEQEYRSKPSLYQNVDIHLIETSGHNSISVLLPMNAERNIARVYARTNYVCDTPSSVILPTDLRRTIHTYTKQMQLGDMLVVPTFEIQQQVVSANDIPRTKKEVLGLVNEGKLGLYDAQFKLNEGPTDLEKWKKAKDVYKVENYTIDYEPLVIQSKTVQPWCSERFVDKRSACLLSSYLAGNDFLVLPNDFAIYKPSARKHLVSDLDRVIEKRLYSKFYWEECVYHARELDSMGLWKTSKSNHIRQQCSRIIQNWEQQQQQQQYHINRFTMTTTPTTTTTTTTTTTDMSGPPRPISTAPAFQSIGYDEREKRTYELVVCQQPLHARMCGFGEKDRRPIDPPPIVQLIVKQNDVPVDIQSLQIPFFVLHVTLWSDDRTEERNIISNPPKCTRVLMGSLVSSPSLLKNAKNEPGLYFAFPDLSIRTEGRYTLRFSLMKLANSDFQENAKSKIVAQVFSDPFTVYSAKKFPGMTESTELSKIFAKQGLKIPIRNDVRARKTD